MVRMLGIQTHTRTVEIAHQEGGQVEHLTPMLPVIVGLLLGLAHHERPIHMLIVAKPQLGTFLLGHLIHMLRMEVRPQHGIPPLGHQILTQTRVGLLGDGEVPLPEGLEAVVGEGLPPGGHLVSTRLPHHGEVLHQDDLVSGDHQQGQAGMTLAQVLGCVFLSRIRKQFLVQSQSDAPVGAPTPAAWGAPTPAAPTPGFWGAPTPAPVTYDTPAGDAFSHGIPQTPGFTDSYSSMNAAEGRVTSVMPYTSSIRLLYFPAELPDKWLLDSALSNKKGMLAEIRNSTGRTGDGWHGGDYEGEKAVILSVLDTHNDSFRSTATIRFVNPQVSLDQPVIPVEYLTPVFPDKIGDEVIILHGDHKGSRAKTRESVDSEAWFVSIAESHLMVEVKRKFLIKFVPSN